MEPGYALRVCATLRWLTGTEAQAPPSARIVHDRPRRRQPGVSTTSAVFGDISSGRRPLDGAAVWIRRAAVAADTAVSMSAG